MDDRPHGSDRPLFGLVLAGGKSRRMGCDKGSLLHPDGRSLARRTVELLAAAGCQEVFLSLRPEQTPPPDLTGFPQTKILRDEGFESIGPMGGVLAAMNHDKAADWLVVACDLPRLNLETLRDLIQNHSLTADFVAYRGEPDGLPEPLCAIYPGSRKSTLDRARDAGDFRLRRLLIRNPCVLLEPAPGVLTNTNTPDDWHYSMANHSFEPNQNHPSS